MARILSPLPVLLASGLLALVTGAGCATSSSAGAGDADEARETPGAHGARAHEGTADEGIAARGKKGGQEDGAQITGVVRETMDSGGYTYMQVELDDGQLRWAAAEETEVGLGDKVTLRVSMKLTDFHSKTLERTFDSIWFVYIEQIQRAGAPPAPSSDTI